MELQNGKPWQRRRWSVLVNIVSGKVAVKDMYEERLGKMQRRVRGWADVVAVMAKKMPLRLVMVDLTYDPKRSSYKPKDIQNYMKSTKQRLGEKLIGWAWVAELHRDGRLHYHVIFAMKRGTNFPMPDKGGSWPHGMSKVQTARTPFYLVTYVGKEYQKDLSQYPKSCRLYAVSIRPESYREALRITTGMANVRTPERSWAFVGTSVTREYADDVLTGRAASRVLS
jgi:hypothetical protein